LSVLPFLFVAAVFPDSAKFADNEQTTGVFPVSVYYNARVINLLGMFQKNNQTFLFCFRADRHLL
jgi:hypothetical protein